MLIFNNIHYVQKIRGGIGAYVGESGIACWACGDTGNGALAVGNAEWVYR